MVPTKTNNSYLGNKIELRAKHLPDNPSVLDCYGGQGLIWRGVSQKTGKKIKRIGIDKFDYGVGFYLTGDNLSYLKTIDLYKFNVIDLDAYGVPYEQLKILFDRKYKGTIFLTFIQSVYGMMPMGMMAEIGFSEEMYRTIPTIFGKNGWGYFLEYLALKGVRSIIHRSHKRKHYLCFEM